MEIFTGGNKSWLLGIHPIILVEVTSAQSSNALAKYNDPQHNNCFNVKAFFHAFLNFTYGPFPDYLRIACHKAKIKEKTHAGHRIQIFLMFFDEIQIIFMVLVHLHYVHGHEILNWTLIYSTVICHKRILRQNHCCYSLFINILPRANAPS